MRRHPVPLLGPCSAPTLACMGRKKHNKLQSRPTEEFPQPRLLWGQIIITHRLNNSAHSKWMPFSAHFSAPGSGCSPRVCMHVCVCVRMCSEGASNKNGRHRTNQPNTTQAVKPPPFSRSESALMEVAPWSTFSLSHSVHRFTRFLTSCLVKDKYYFLHTLWRTAVEGLLVLLKCPLYVTDWFNRLVKVHVCAWDSWLNHWCRHCVQCHREISSVKCRDRINVKHTYIHCRKSEICLQNLALFSCYASTLSSYLLAPEKLHISTQHPTYM